MYRVEVWIRDECGMWLIDEKEYGVVEKVVEVVDRVVKRFNRVLKEVYVEGMKVDDVRKWLERWLGDGGVRIELKLVKKIRGRLKVKDGWGEDEYVFEFDDVIIDVYSE